MECQVAFEKLKHLFAAEPVLKHPDLNGVIQTNASDLGVIQTNASNGTEATEKPSVLQNISTGYKAHYSHLIQFATSKTSCSFVF